MPKRSSKAKGDANVIGFLVAQVATGSIQPNGTQRTTKSGGPKARNGPPATPSGPVDQGHQEGQAEEGKNPAAVALGRLGGLKGGAARARSLSAKKRSEIAKKAARARWKAK